MERSGTARSDTARSATARSGRVLVAGASGVVGEAALRHFAGLDGWEAVGASRRPPRDVEPATWVALDLADRARCSEVLGRLGGVTHLVYAAVSEAPGLVAGWHDPARIEANRRMFEHVLDAVADGPLEHVSLLQGTKAYGVHVAEVPIPARERAPRHPHDNFYFEQEDLLRRRARTSSWAWTILRPQVVFGDALGSNMNLIPVLGVYGALLKQAGEPLHFPGGAPSVSEAVDADLLAVAIEWAATSPAARNEVFNITNGDVFVWRDVWPAIATALGMAPGEHRPHSLAAALDRAGDRWAALAADHHLLAPTRLAEVVGQSPIYADMLLGHGRDRAPLPALVSTIKIRQAGFGACTDTEEMFGRWLARMQQRRLLPPP